MKRLALYFLPTLLVLMTLTTAHAQTLHVTGFVFNDFNGNGVLDPNENPITNPAAQFPESNGGFLFDANMSLVAIASANAADGYSFVIDFPVPPGGGGIWTVTPESAPVGYHLTSPASGKYTVDTTLYASDATIPIVANFGFTNHVTDVPEPGSVALLGSLVALGGMGLLRKRRKTAA